MNFAKGLLRRMSVASTAVGAFMFAWPAAEPAMAQSLDIPGLDSLANTVGGAFEKKQDDGPIDYRPRPALVVPPSFNLPPPQPHVARSTDWPKDPDAAALRNAKADSRRPAPKTAAQEADEPRPKPPAPAKKGWDDLSTLPEGSFDPIGAARRAWAPPQDANSGSDGGGSADKCNSFAGICMRAPWDKGNVALNSKPSRKYLIDPPLDYVEPIPISRSKPKSAQDRSGQKPTGAVAAAPAPGEKPPSKCMFPGWFGCPEQRPVVQVSQGGPASGQTQAAQPAAAGATASADTGAAASQPAAKKCMFPGWFGCPEQTQPDQLSQGDPASGQTQSAQPAATTASAETGGPASQPAAKNCMFPGWFGCPEK